MEKEDEQTDNVTLSQCASDSKKNIVVKNEENKVNQNKKKSIQTDDENTLSGEESGRIHCLNNIGILEMSLFDVGLKTADPFVCIKCGAEFDKLDELLKHEKSHRKEDETQLDSDESDYSDSSCAKRCIRCRECGVEFTRLSSLKRHIATVTHEKCHFCPSCDEAFQHARELHRHTKLVHFGGKPFKCNVCERRFEFCSALQTHTRAHNKERPFTCPECDKGFTTRSNLNAHLGKHSAGNQHGCDSCKRKFACFASLRRHKQKVHAKDMSCPSCDQHFAILNDLKLHMRKHEGKKCHACSLCDKEYCELSGLRKHMSNVHRKKLYHCRRCSMTFVSREEWKTHTKIHVDEKEPRC